MNFQASFKPTLLFNRNMLKRKITRKKTKYLVNNQANIWLTARLVKIMGIYQASFLETTSIATR